MPDLSLWEVDKRAESVSFAISSGASGHNLVPMSREIYAYLTGADLRSPKEVVLEALERAGVT